MRTKSNLSLTKNVLALVLTANDTNVNAMLVIASVVDVVVFREMRISLTALNADR